MVPAGVLVPAAEASGDYALVDSLVNALRPLEYGVELAKHTEQQCIDLLNRESFLSSVKTISFDDSSLVAPPFILGETCYPNYEFESCESDIVDWIDAFFDTFIHSECTNEKLQSVCISWQHKRDDRQKSRMPKLLSEPSAKDVRIPRDDFAAYRYASEYHVSQCDMYSLTSTKTKKRMDVFKWTGESPGFFTVDALLCEVKDI